MITYSIVYRVCTHALCEEDKRWIHFWEKMDF